MKNKISFKRFQAREIVLTIKEVFLQLLFPPVCPVCGKILKLPKMGNLLFRAFIFSNIHILNITPPSDFRSFMICDECITKLPYVREPRCICCSRPLEAEDEIYCDICRRRSLFFDGGSALFLHDATAKKIIYDLKFHNLRDNARFLGFEFALRFHDLIFFWKPDVCIPVPLHKKRFRQRSFNQAQLIAEWFSFWIEKLYRIHLSVDSEYLLRTENTRPQRILESGMRSGNVRNAFSISCQNAEPRPESNKNKVPRYRCVLLIDDIFTSGSTIDACSRTLKEAGCRQVFFLTASIV